MCQDVTIRVGKGPRNDAASFRRSPAVPDFGRSSDSLSMRCRWTDAPGCRKDVHGAPGAVNAGRATRHNSIACLPPSSDDAGARAPSARPYRRIGRRFCRHRTAAHLEGPGWRRGAGRAVPGRRANATITGPEGLEIRRDVWIGVSLMAPHTRYSDQRHPPEEIYVVLSDGQWCQASGPWHEPGIGGLVYNPPNVAHAMRSTERPLLALWFLWTEQISS